MQKVKRERKKERQKEKQVGGEEQGENATGHRFCHYLYYCHSDKTSLSRIDHRGYGAVCVDRPQTPAV